MKNNMKKKIGEIIKNDLRYLMYGRDGVKKREELQKLANELREKGYHVLIDEENLCVLYF